MKNFDICGVRLIHASMQQMGGFVKGPIDDRTTLIEFHAVVYWFGVLKLATLVISMEQIVLFDTAISLLS